jgi:hypothetical protein
MFLGKHSLADEFGHLIIPPGGTNYITPAIIVLGGAESGASATLTLASGAITGYNTTSVGAGYSTAPTCTVVPDGDSFRL